MAIEELDETPEVQNTKPTFPKTKEELASYMSEMMQTIFNWQYDLLDALGHDCDLSVRALRSHVYIFENDVASNYSILRQSIQRDNENRN